MSQYRAKSADAILSSDLPTPLRGVAIGNGWLDARRQYPAYLDYAVKHGIIEENSEVRPVVHVVVPVDESYSI